MPNKFCKEIFFFLIKGSMAYYYVRFCILAQQVKQGGRHDYFEAAEYTVIRWVAGVETASEEQPISHIIVVLVWLRTKRQKKRNTINFIRKIWMRNA